MLQGSFYSKGQKVLNREGDLGEVWISGYHFAHNIKELEKNNIFAVCSGVDLDFKYPGQFQHLKFNLDDYDEQRVDQTFQPAFQFIESSRKKTNVLVHCAAGISRCSMLLSSYMMRKYKMKLDACLQKIIAARQCCEPNPGFIKQLKEYESKLGLN